MSAKTDFIYDVERAAGLTLDATCAARCAAHLPLPQPHRRLLAAAVRKLESAQDDLFTVRNSPWDQPRKSKSRQLSFLN